MHGRTHPPADWDGGVMTFTLIVIKACVDAPDDIPAARVAAVSRQLLARLVGAADIVQADNNHDVKITLDGVVSTEAEVRASLGVAEPEAA